MFKLLQSAEGRCLDAEVILDDAVLVVLKKIETYIANPSVQQKWSDFYQRSTVFCSDAVLMDTWGDEGRLLMIPTPVMPLHQDSLHTGSFIWITRAARVPGPRADTSVVMVTGWERSPSFPSTNRRSALWPPFYPTCPPPLMAPYSNLLCPWTRLSLRCLDAAGCAKMQQDAA